MLNKIFFLFLLSVALCTVGLAQSNMQKILTLADAKSLVKAAEERAGKDNWNVVIAIVDAGGHLIYLERMDGAQIGSVEVAQKKARAALLFKRPTKIFEDGVKSGNNGIMLLPNVIASEGGVPIFHDNNVIGAIGISGVTSAQDGIIANAALEGFE